jgi:hypothetical protein
MLSCHTRIPDGGPIDCQTSVSVQLWAAGIAPNFIKQQLLLCGHSAIASWSRALTLIKQNTWLGRRNDFGSPTTGELDSYTPHRHHNAMYDNVWPPTLPENFAEELITLLEGKKMMRSDSEKKTARLSSLFIADITVYLELVASYLSGSCD